jgi:hypothetical protein
VKALSVTDIPKMRMILETFSHLDDIRWAAASNYNLINYCCEDLTPDEKLLTHWLCYIADRQMDFRRVWDVGGYVISHLVQRYSRESDSKVKELLYSYISINGGKLSLKCTVQKPNIRLGRYGFSGDSVDFASRYPPEDLTRVFRTLAILGFHYERSLSRFIARAIAEETDCRQAIKKVANALNDLTYVGGEKVAATNFDERINAIEKEAKEFVLRTEISQEMPHRKRLWCALRDYLKSPEFNDVFVAALQHVGMTNARLWKRDVPNLKKALVVLELPGDVWNNWKVFRKGLFDPYLQNKPKSWAMPRTIRRLYEVISDQRPTCFYPEQLDVTFDFVPRMCVPEMCDVCLFGGGIEGTCHQRQGKLCSVALLSCGHRHLCNPDKCTLRQDSVRGLCQSSVAFSKKEY